MSVDIRVGDCRDVLASLAASSVQCCVTSPPYFGLRDYNVAGQIGLEPTPDEYVAKLVNVFNRVRRALADDGTLWLNLGDSYAGSGKGGNPADSPHQKQRTNAGSVSVIGNTAQVAANTRGAGDDRCFGLKSKDLIGIPWRVALALQADGWYLRSDIIWNKPNPMPESVADRPTKAHEYLFLLSKSHRYYYDAAAISERITESGVVAGADCDGERPVLSQYLGLENARPAGAAIGVRLAAAVLDLAQRQDDVSLLPFDAEIGKQRTDRGARLPVVEIPVMRRAATEASRFADGDIPAKEFLREMHRLCVALPDGDDLKETWRLATLHVGHIASDGDRSIAIDDACQIRQIESSHNKQDSILRVPSPRESSRRASGNVYTAQAFTHPQSAPRGPKLDFGPGNAGTRNRRSVWTVATTPYSGAHFATFPPALIEPCILAGSRIGDTILDPFGGAGTTGLVADRLNRNALLIELNPEYATLARNRITDDNPLFAGGVA